MNLAIGIDLGTTNSVIAHINANGRAEVIANAEGQPITPSVVFFGSEPPLVGDLAKEKQAEGDDRVASFFKRYMGDPTFKFNHDGRDWTPTELSALVLDKLKTDAEAALGAPIRQAVITVPAYFNESQRKATIAAGQQVGLEVLAIINEPTAAVLAYRIPIAGKAETILVYDLGGGTFDVSLVRLAANEVTVLATDGDHFLGGKDWDDRIAGYLAKQFEEEHGVNPLADNLSFNEILVLAERIKKILKDRQSTQATIHYQSRTGTYEISRSRFEELTRDLMERTQRLCELVLQAGKTSWAELTGVLLVGGSTRLPMVHEYVTRLSGKKPMTGVNVDEAVALGAAVKAADKLAERDGSSSTFLLVATRRTRDVMSHALGMVACNEKRDGYFNSILIPRNTPIPCVNSQTYQIRTHRNADNQFDVYVLQGESIDPTHCHILGKYTFSGIAHVPVRPALVNIEFGYDANGVITVAATDSGTGKTLKLSIEALPGDMSWLSAVAQQKQLSSGSPYTLHAGQQRIPGAVSDKFGNAAGSQYDLAADGAFDDCLIAVLHLYTSEGFHFRYPETALQEKGFKIHRWTSAPAVAELSRVLEEACQLWIIADKKQHLNAKQLEVIRAFFESGRGLYVWGDNDPYFVDANFVAQGLFGCRMSGNTHGDQVMGLQQRPGGAGIVSHLITTGVEHLYEGITVATIQAHPGLQPVLYGSASNLLVAAFDADGRRAIIDGGFTRLFMKWDTAGTGRYVKNAAAWLVNCERLWGAGVESVRRSSGLRIL